MRTPSTDASALAQLCGISDVKTAGNPLHPLQDEITAYWRCWAARKQSTRCQRNGGVIYLLALSRASVFNVTPIMSLWASRVSRQSGDRKVGAL